VKTCEGAEVEAGFRKVGELGSNFFEFLPGALLDVAAGAAQAPFGVGHFADAASIGEGGGFEVLREFVEQGLILSGVVAGEEDGLGAEAQAEVDDASPRGNQFPAAGVRRDSGASLTLIRRARRRRPPRLDRVRRRGMCQGER
jgi:hypothetical protein